MDLIEMKGHGHQGLHGGNPNPPHYIKESLALEMALVMCVRTKEWPISKRVLLFSQVSKVFGDL